MADRKLAAALAAKRDTVLSARVSDQTRRQIGKLAKTQGVSVADLLTLWAHNAPASRSTAYMDDMDRQRMLADFGEKVLIQAGQLEAYLNSK